MQASLFQEALQPNLIPYDGQVHYWPHVIEASLANHNLAALQATIDWKPDVVTIFGKTHITNRLMALYAGFELSYKYSGQIKKAQNFPPILHEIKQKVEQTTGLQYNACLLNLYHNGTESMGWHSDNEPEMLPNSSIASLSLGATRVFQFKHRASGQKVSINLEHGSLLEMAGPVQQYWLHQLPKALKVKSCRINLTFRQMQSR